MPGRALLAALIRIALLGPSVIWGDVRQPGATVVGQAVRRDDEPDIERLLHAERCPDAVVAITQRLAAGAASAPVSPGERLTVAELALLAALVCESPALTRLLSPARIERGKAASFWYIHGVLAARQAWPGARAAPLGVARAAATQLEALASAEGRWSRTEVRRVSVLASIAAAQEERDELTLLLAHANTLDAQLRDVRLEDDHLLPLDELAGDLWLQLHRFEDALRYYRSATRRHPERTRAWIGRARAAREAGAEAEAREAATRVLTAWGARGGLEPVRAEMTEISTGRARR
jgi:hypothetical protein